MSQEHQKKIIAFVILAAFLYAGYRVYRYVFRSDEERIRDVFADIQDAVEERNGRRIIEHVSESYNHRDMGRDELRGLLFRYFTQYEAITCRVLVREVRVEGDAAHATADVLLLEGQQVSVIDFEPRGARAMRMEVDLRREEKNEWRIAAHTQRDLESVQDFVER